MGYKYGLQFKERPLSEVAARQCLAIDIKIPSSIISDSSLNRLLSSQVNVQTSSIQVCAGQQEVLAKKRQAGGQ